MVFGVSFGLWLLAQFGVQYKLFDFASSGWPIDLGQFDLMGWQLLYVAGFLFGAFHYRSGNIGLDRHPWILKVAYAVAAILFLFRHNLIFETSKINLGLITGRAAVGPLRLVNFASVCILVSLRSLWPEQAAFVRGLAFLGRNSLQVFSMHVIVVNSAWILFPDLQNPQNRYLSAMPVILISVAVLYLVAWMHEVWKNKRKTRTTVALTASAEQSVR